MHFKMYCNKAYNLYKKCLTCEKCPPKGCPIYLEWQSMDRNYYYATGKLITGEKFHIHHPNNEKNIAEITLEKIDNLPLTQLNSWILAFMDSKYNVDITLTNITPENLNNIIAINEDRGTIHITNDMKGKKGKKHKTTYKGWKITNLE